ncbi:MAG: RDD family protein [Lacunisphaera sp.]
MFTIQGGDGKEYGPVTIGKIHEWIAAGRANMQTMAHRYGETEWKPLGDFPEISQFGTTGSPTPPPIPEYPVTAVMPVSHLTASTTATLELAPASRWLRLGAAILDGIIGGILVMPGFVLVTAAGFFTNPTHPNAPLMAEGLGLLGLGFLILMSIQIYLLTTRGQTIGKKLLAIKIVNFDDETNPGFVKAFLLRSFVNGLIASIPVVGPVYSLVDLCFIFRDDRRCLHDLLAGTKVVNA